MELETGRAVVVQSSRFKVQSLSKFKVQIQGLPGCQPDDLSSEALRVGGSYLSAVMDAVFGASGQPDEALA
jgi:hypothetical protein